MEALSSSRRIYVFLALTVTGLGLGGLFLALEARLQRGREPSAPQSGPHTFHRIVSLAPNVTECVYALGCGSRLVGVSEFCVFPDEATRLPRVGGLIKPNLEVLTALNPDLVLAQMPNEAVRLWCEQRGIAYYELGMMNLATIRAGVLKMGKILDVPQRGAEFAARLDARIERVTAAVAGLARPRVLFVINRTPGSLSGIYAPGPGSFLDEMLTLAGADNIMSEAGRAYPLVSKEIILEKGPEIIVETRPGAELSPALETQIREDWSRLPRLPAVMNGRIEILTEDFLQVPGPRVPLILERLARVCHPDLELPEAP